MQFRFPDEFEDRSLISFIDNVVCYNPYNLLVFGRETDNGVFSDGYNIEFTFDTDVACAVRVYLFANENLAGGIAR